MEEIKLRILAVETGLGTARALLPGPITSEFCFLQLRMIFELVALGCLVAHGEVTEEGKGKRLLNEWNAEIIMTELGKLHPHFFPFPVRLVRTPEMPTNVHLEDRPGQMTKADFLFLYGRTGSALHRGTINKLIGRKRMNPIGDKEIVEWTQKVIGLLNDHRIASWDNRRQIICVMKDANLGGRASVAFAEAPAETSTEQAQSLFPKDT